MNHANIKLTASEIACVWTTYINDCMSKCVLIYMLKHLEDEDIKPIIQMALGISETHLDFLTTLFKKENFAAPNAFNENDVNLNAPRLYTDSYCISYVNHMAKAGMLAFSGMVAMSAREDIRSFFTTALTQTAALYNDSSEVLLSKGLFVRSPFIEVPGETDYIDSKKYLSGLNLFGDKRPLNAIEISHLFLNVHTNSIGAKISLSFAQTSPSKEVQEFMLRGKEISQKHVTIFAQTLLENNLQTPESSDIGITDSTIQVFSEKLMMYHMALLSAAGSGNYATAAAASQRTDLYQTYDRLSLEIAKFAKSGADIMIKNSWLEQPPGTKDKEMLSKKKEG